MTAATRHEINYRRGMYAGAKPYRDCLVAALQHFGLTSFTEQTEFWTLGGKEWYEYKFLKEQGLTFSKASYHNVDYGDIDPCNDQSVVIHKCNFFDIWRVWKRPTAICFDSTNGLVTSNEKVWLDLIQLGIAAAEITGKVSLNWNFLAGYGNRLGWRGPDDKVKGKSRQDVLFDRYERWLNAMKDHITIAGFRVDFFSYSVMAPKEKSRTPMISGHCLIFV